MLKLTKTGIGLLTKQYRSVLRKCLLLNIGILVLSHPICSYAWNYNDATLSAPRGFESTSEYAVRIVGGNLYASYGHQTISTNLSVEENLEALDRVIGSYAVNSAGATEGRYASNWDLIDRFKLQDAPTRTVYNMSSVIGSLIELDYVIGLIESGYNISKVKTIGENLKALDTAIGAKIVSDGHYIKESDTNSITANLSALDYALYNYYYTFRVDERDEVIDSASFFQKDFSTLQKVDLQSKNPTHLRAFTKCDEACPRPSERFSLSLSQEQMFKNNASVDAGTSRHCLRQFDNVLANLLKNMASKYAKMNDFMNVEV